jgi:hypothetical protein
MASSWDLHSIVAPAALMERRAPGRSIDDVTTDCPRCGALASVEEFTSTTKAGTVRKRLIRCPNAKGSKATCRVTEELLEPAKEQQVPLITTELSERIAILREAGITQRGIADLAGIPKGSISPFVIGAQPLAPERIDRLTEAVSELESGLRQKSCIQPPPPHFGRAHGAGSRRAACA